MQGWLKSLRHRPRLALALALPALLLRIAIPPGFMPATTVGAAFTMQMCPGHASMPTSAGSERQGGGKHHDAPCVFAAAAGLAPVPGIAAADLVDARQAQCVHVEPQLDVGGSRPAAHRPRAPPVPV